MSGMYSWVASRLRSGPTLDGVFFPPRRQEMRALSPHMEAASVSLTLGVSPAIGLSSQGSGGGGQDP